MGLTSNVDEILNKLDKLPEALAKTLVKKGFAEALQPMAAAVRSTAPKDTGKLVEGVLITKARAKRGTIYCNVRTLSKYVAAQEYGWESGGVLHPGRHFLKRAFDQSKGTVKNNAIEAIRQSLEDAAKS